MAAPRSKTYQASPGGGWTQTSIERLSNIQIELPGKRAPRHLIPKSHVVDFNLILLLSHAAKWHPMQAYLHFASQSRYLDALQPWDMVENVVLQVAGQVRPPKKKCTGTWKLLICLVPAPHWRRCHSQSSQAHPTPRNFQLFLISKKCDQPPYQKAKQIICDKGDELVVLLAFWHINTPVAIQGPCQGIRSDVRIPGLTTPRAGDSTPKPSWGCCLRFLEQPSLHSRAVCGWPKIEFGSVTLALRKHLNNKTKQIFTYIYI